MKKHRLLRNEVTGKYKIQVRSFLCFGWSTLQKSIEGLPMIKIDAEFDSIEDARDEYRKYLGQKVINEAKWIELSQF